MAYYHVAIIPLLKNGFSVSIPDFPEGSTSADTFEEAIENAEDVLAICAEEYTRERRVIPMPSSIEAVKQKVALENEEYKAYVDFSREVYYQAIKLPSVDTKPVRVAVSFPKNILEQIDKKAEGLGLTRSKLLANGALAYEG
ncbi:MAG: type II toxin-antitoxin system HicB family antitoxin [Pseudomonadota bacterium]